MHTPSSSPPGDSLSRMRVRKQNITEIYFRLDLFLLGKDIYSKVVDLKQEVIRMFRNLQKRVKWVSAVLDSCVIPQVCRY